jgi:peptidoglycan-associated lipoprotein
MLKIGRWASVFVFGLGVTLGGCGKKAPPAPVEAPKEVVQVLAVEPAVVDVGETATVVVRGAQFADGARLYFGTVEGTNVVRVDAEHLQAAVPALAVGTYDVTVVNPSNAQGVLSQGLRVQEPRPVAPPAATACSLQVVNFGYNEALLIDAARNVIKANADCLQQKGARELRLEGHADERGSTEYNLALGQRRSDSVRKYLESIGLSLPVASVSYGEEKPAAVGSDESAWSKNRRVEFVIP